MGSAASLLGSFLDLMGVTFVSLGLEVPILHFPFLDCVRIRCGTTASGIGLFNSLISTYRKQVVVTDSIWCVSGN